MSANPVARPQSRRGILTAALAGTAAGAATFAGHVSFAGTTPPAVDPGEAALVRWINRCCLLNARPTNTDEEWNATAEIEREIINAPPSIDAAAARCLHEIAFHADADGDHPPSYFKTYDERLPFDIVRALRAHMSPRLAMLAGDILDNFDRPLCESILGRAYLGEKSL